MQREKIEQDIPAIIRNDEGLYEGNLVAYYAILKKHTTKHPFHNLVHTHHVLWACYQACKFYKREKMLGQVRISKLSARILFIAAMFHDLARGWGNEFPDDENVARAVQAFREHILPEDRPHLRKILELIKATRYPYKQRRSRCVLAQILREADLSQALADDWQDTVSALAKEYGVARREMLEKQTSFLKKMRFYSRWGRTDLRPLRTNRIADVQKKLAF